MGIPKFFRWLTRRYPLILKNIGREEDCPPIGKFFQYKLIEVEKKNRSLFKVLMH